MNDAKKAALAAIDEKKELVAEVADAIWDYAELSMQEVKSAALFVKVLKAEGFQVEEGICGIPTAFSASFGSGGPVIGLLAEYDALSGLSQEAGSTAYHELVKGGSGHGCGHNLLGAGGHGRRHRPEALSDPDRKKRHRHPVRLPRRGGRGVQGLYGSGGPVVRP